MSESVRAIICPSCGIADFTIDVSKGIITCNKCGQIVKGPSQDLLSYSTTTSATRPEAILETEEARFLRLRLIVSPHTHEEFNKINEVRQDIETLKKDVSEVKETIAKIGVERPLKVREIEVKEMTTKEARPIVERFLQQYLETHEEVYPSDVADELGLRYELAKEIFDELEKEGKLKKKGG